ncbi:MAG: RagB/SusD family nutrient uptake outer membrane protein [Paludibacteraceae bacterium]|nr:RagB/SusD family nutrient uptake outer membrane protein [Paludibacteraceae bacterium]
MKMFLKYIYVVVFVLSFAGCSFLNQEPYDDFTDEEFWRTEDQVRSFMYGFYTSVFSGYGTGTSHGPFLMGQTLNDDFASDKTQIDLQPTVVPVSDGAWSFANIRRANYVLENIDRLEADRVVRAHWRGVARFFRACYYSNLVFTFGDVPWFDHVPVVSANKQDLDYLYKDRDSRLFVDSCIMADLQYAMDSVRKTDGAQQVNRYIVAGMASRLMLREGTFLKYHNIDADMAQRCLLFAKDAALVVMNSGNYSIAPSYNALFTSDDLAGNPEVLMYRHYVDGVLSHSTLTYSFTEAQAGLSASLAEAFLTDDGLPVYVKDPLWTPRNADEFFAGRDPRLSLCIRPHYYLKGTDCQPFQYALSGYSWCKFMDDSRAAKPEATWSGSKNVTDAPCLRYAEVLLNYAEAAYELSQMSGAYSFSDEDLDKSVNLIRARLGVNLPPLKVVGNKPSVNGMVFDDPKRMEIEVRADGGETSPILWEIRRERRTELCLEGFRLNDLKRWRKLDYLWNDCNPDIRYGAYIVLSDYSNLDAEIVLEDPNATEGYVLRNTGAARNRPVERNYIAPIPSGQIHLYETKGYHLSQNKVWE